MAAEAQATKFVAGLGAELVASLSRSLAARRQFEGADGLVSESRFRAHIRMVFSELRVPSLKQALLQNVDSYTASLWKQYSAALPREAPLPLESPAAAAAAVAAVVRGLDSGVVSHEEALLRLLQIGSTKSGEAVARTQYLSLLSKSMQPSGASPSSAAQVLQDRKSVV